MCTLLDLCVSSLRRGHANLLCTVPSLTDDPRMESRGGRALLTEMLSPRIARQGTVCLSSRQAPKTRTENVELDEGFQPYLIESLRAPLLGAPSL